MQQLELLRSQLQPFAGTGHLARVHIQCDILIAYCLIRCSALLALTAQQRPHTCKQLFQRKRLHEIIVRSEIKPFDTVLNFILSRQH
ncbi:hypothetical protein D3C76_1553090 [compost metagenome]